MLTQIAIFLVDTIATFFVFLLLARFHFQWLRAPFRNPAGEFVVAATNWAVKPARRVIPGVAGIDLATLLLAWIFQTAGLWAQVAIAGGQPAAAALVAVAAVDLLRYSVYFLVFALVVQAVLSWTNPYTPIGPVFDALTRPFLRPIRRLVPPIGGVDLTPLILVIVLQVLLIPLVHLRAAAAMVG
jgi:YggT family protein